MKTCAVLWLLPVFSVVGGSLPLQVSLLDNDILHVRAGDISGNFTQAIQAAAPTNRIAGTVLDLRFAGGSNASGADYFADQKTPLVILVNGETRGAAATLATQLHAAHKAILIGSTNPPGLVLPDISVAVPRSEEKAFQQNPYAQAPGADDVALTASNTFLPFVDHTSEADLVRQKIKDGEEFEAAAPVPAKPQPRVIHDPELARAVDLLKAITVFRSAHG